MIEQIHLDTNIRRSVIEPTDGMVVIGSGKNVDLRLIGEDVAPVHSVIECRNGEWVLCDLGSASGTWHNNKSIVEVELNTSSEIQIGNHLLKLTLVNMGRPLFEDLKSLSEGNSIEGFHQILIRRNGKILETIRLNHDEVFTTIIDGKEKTFVVPSPGEVNVEDLGTYEIVQRLVMGVEKAEPEVFRIDSRIKWPVLGVTSFLLVLFLAIVFVPQEPDVELDLPELKKNRYARMIFDAKVTKKNKRQAQKIVKKRLSKAGSGASKSAAKAPIPTGTKKGARVVSKIRSAGLSALIGKIAKRSISNIDSIQARGVTPDSARSGRALASIGSANAIKGMAKGVGAFKLKGIKTSGKGGGSGSYKNGSSLSGGSVGNAEVGIIEDETVVDGGLDRSIIAEIIEKHLGQIRYCYERQLSADPGLYGKVLVSFNIGSNGGVTTQTIGTTTLKNAMVEGCILRRVARWRFPEPKGGTTVKVTYPFLFKSHQ